QSGLRTTRRISAKVQAGRPAPLTPAGASQTRPARTPAGRKPQLSALAPISKTPGPTRSRLGLRLHRRPPAPTPLGTPWSAKINESRGREIRPVRPPPSIARQPAATAESPLR